MPGGFLPPVRDEQPACTYSTVHCSPPPTDDAQSQCPDQEVPLASHNASNIIHYKFTTTLAMEKHRYHKTHTKNIAKCTYMLQSSFDQGVPWLPVFLLSEM